MLPTFLCASLLLGYAWSLMSLHRIEAEMRAYYLLDRDLALDRVDQPRLRPTFRSDVPSADACQEWCAPKAPDKLFE
jgi:hypothetical protein